MNSIDYWPIALDEVESARFIKMNFQENSFHAPHVQPVIIIGMHRSGTSFLANALHQCGLFMGADTQGNHESVMFMLSNNSIFNNCYATWNSPFGVHLALQNEETVSSFADSVSTSLVSNSEKYLGSDRADGIRNFADINFPWGWKDPRTTFTLPVWRRIFPGIKIIHILRHGVDVAKSLYQRDSAVYQNKKNPYIPALGMMQDSLGLYHRRPCRSLEQAFILWEEYVDKAVQQVNDHGNNAIQLKYEDLLLNPKPNLRRILAFCGLKSKSIPSGLVSSINSSRAYSYKQHPALVKHANNWQDALAKYGY